MKMTKSLLAIAILGAAVQANAAQYNVTGNLTALKTVGATSTPTLTLTPSQPAFAGIWGIDTATNNIVGGLDFVSYQTAVSVLSGLLTATVTQSNAVYRYAGGAGTASYNAATKTLTVGQVLNYGAASGTSSTQLLWNTVADSSIGASAAVNGSCSGNSTICGGQNTQFLAKPNMEQFYMTLTFNGVGDVFSHFTGTAVGVEVGGAVSGGVTGNTWSNYTFQGSAIAPVVPVPAAAWLFGSSLVGLAGVARRRQAV